MIDPLNAVNISLCRNIGRFCNNSSKQGYVMKIFLKDSKRRMQWINNINNKYKNWIPSQNSYVR